MKIFRVKALPEAALAASACFYAEVLPQLENVLRENAEAQEPFSAILLCFPSANYTHRGWRLAVVQELARTFAPVRINAIVGGRLEACAAAEAYLASAAGVTGQVLPL